jgi:predicted RNA-binding Zn ribbon-like protein
MRHATPEGELLLAVLNSTPVVDSQPSDVWADFDVARAWAISVGGRGTQTELGHLRRARSLLQRVVREQADPATLSPLLRGASRVPQVGNDGISWQLRVDPERRLAVRVILAWDTVESEAPGRLRPCANDECQLFLIDTSTNNRARWCSMAVCGNRMKARRHYRRERETRPTSGR